MRDRTNAICEIVNWYKVAKKLEELADQREKSLKGKDEDKLIGEALIKNILKGP